MPLVNRLQDVISADREISRDWLLYYGLYLEDQLSPDNVQVIFHFESHHRDATDVDFSYEKS